MATHRKVNGRYRLVPAFSGMELEGRALLSTMRIAAAADAVRALRVERAAAHIEHELQRVEAAVGQMQSEQHRAPFGLVRLASKLRTRLERIAPVVTSPPPSSSTSTSLAGLQSGPTPQGPSPQTGGTPATTPSSGTGAANQAAAVAATTVLAQFDSSFPQAPPATQAVLSYAWDFSAAPDAIVLSGLGTSSLQIYWHDPNPAGATAADGMQSRIDTVSVTETLADQTHVSTTFTYNLIFRPNPLWLAGEKAALGASYSAPPKGLPGVGA